MFLLSLKDKATYVGMALDDLKRFKKNIIPEKTVTLKLITLGK